MAEYIDREKVFPNGVFYVSAENPESSLNELINRICNLPTADVVPKSEVDRLTIEFEAMRTAANSYKMHYENLARKIFEEIERFLYIHFRFCKEEFGGDDTEYVKGRLELNTQIQNFIAELKKKYVESEV